jgi:uncharacterized phage-associated protein
VIRVALALSFRFAPYKFVSAVTYLANRCGETTKMKIAKLLYFADKEHLLDYGRPVIGDKYIKMEWGPVPSKGYNLMKHDDRASVDDQSLFDEYIEVSGKLLTAKQAADERHLSDSDKEALDSVIAKYGHLTPKQLSDLSHREVAWKGAQMNGEMDYRLFFTSQEDQGIAEILQEDQKLKNELEQMEIEELLVSFRA